MLGLLLLLMAVVSGQDIGGPCGCQSCLEGPTGVIFHYAEEQGDRCGQGCLMSAMDQEQDHQICVCHAPINVTGAEIQFVDSCLANETTTPIQHSPLGNRGYICSRNNWDGHQYCLCSPGQKISVFASVHSNSKEDRRWSLECADIKPEYIVSDTSNWYMASGKNKWDGVQDWNGMKRKRFLSELVGWKGGWKGFWRLFEDIDDNAFLVGMTSDHNNYREDRQYAMFYTRSDHWVLSGCKPLMKLNNFDRNIGHVLGEDEVIARVHSVHNNYREDREFSIVVCRLVKKCGELVKIEYDIANAHETENQGVFAGMNTFDNTRGQSENSVTTQIGVTEQKTLSDSYTYERTSGHTNEVSLSVTAGYNWGVLGNGGNLAVTAGFSHTWSTSQSWSRSNSKEFSDENSRQTSYTANCKAGCTCKLTVSVTVGHAEIPYTMTSKSKGVDGGFCTEKGVMKAVRTWNAKAMSVDTCPPQ